jgi:hypothetical protein
MTAQTRLIALVMLVGAALLAGCSKTVQWEEEVPLNTGETIWVKRSVEYSLQGGAGNPLDLAYRPVRDQTIEFNWGGGQFLYKGDARIMLLAISPQRRPVLLAQAIANSWSATNFYACTTPFYVQLIPDETGRVWRWPPQIEPWLYNIEGNLLLARHAPGEMKKRYSATERQAENSPGSLHNPSQQRVDPAYTGDLCKPKGK